MTHEPHHPQRIAILGIHTGIGKTIASAVIAEALNAHYWKPVQAGLEERDAVMLRQLLTNGESRVHDEAVLLTSPLSPHAAAIIDNVVVDHKNFTWPVTTAPLIIETAGGVLSPISADSTMADFAAYHSLPAILVVQHYLGSINHTLMCIEVLKSRGIPLLGIVINGEENEQSETFIAQYGNLPFIARIPRFGILNNESVRACAMQIKQSLSEAIASAANN